MEQHAPQLLTDFLWIAGLAAVVVLIFQRLKIPDIIGLMMTGIALGPTGFNVIRDGSGVSTTAELGVALLLFTIGLEFSFTELKRLKRVAVVGGTAQILLTIAVLAGLALLWHAPGWGGTPGLSQAIVLGILGSLSSTAIVLRVLNARREVEAPHGQVALGILLWQDVAVVFLLWAVSFLGHGEQAAHGVAGQHPVLVLPVLTATVLGLKWVLPRVSAIFSEVHSREVFVLISLFLCFGAAKLTSVLGLSPALGAFAAGVVIAGTDVGSKVAEAVSPIRDALASLFFVSIGLLVDVRLGAVPVLALSAGGVIIAKAVVVGAICLALSYPLRVAIISALSLAQIGEFAFVILTGARQSGLLGGELYQSALVTVILTQMATPFLMARAPRIADGILKVLGKATRAEDAVAAEESHEPPLDVLIIGFGISGQRVNEQVSGRELSIRIFEMNRATVRRLARTGLDIHYGDATDPKRLRQVGAARARFVVVSVSDSEAVSRIVRNVRAINPSATILARVRYRLYETQARDAGADQVLVEEVETSTRIAEILMKMAR